MARLLFLLLWLARVSRCDEEYQFWEAAGLGDVAAMAALLEAVPNLDLEHEHSVLRDPSYAGPEEASSAGTTTTTAGSP